jgi:predicted TIM-barrel fold metal-dependent hydrolase
MGKASSETFFGKLIETFGANRIAWGSNFPNRRHTKPEFSARPRPGVRNGKRGGAQLIFGKTAQRLYPRLAD